jgi:hypothetical protein
MINVKVGDRADGQLDKTIARRKKFVERTYKKKQQIAADKALDLDELEDALIMVHSRVALLADEFLDEAGKAARPAESSPENLMIWLALKYGGKNGGMITLLEKKADLLRQSQFPDIRTYMAAHQDLYFQCLTIDPAYPETRSLERVVAPGSMDMQGWTVQSEMLAAKMNMGEQMSFMEMERILMRLEVQMQLKA